MLYYLHSFLPNNTLICYTAGKIGPNGIAVTNAGQLQCSHIIHIDARRSDLAAVIDSVLEEADSLRIESIAFPALGTGKSINRNNKQLLNNDEYTILLYNCPFQDYSKLVTLYMVLYRM